MAKIINGIFPTHIVSEFPLVKMDPRVRAAKEKKVQQECTNRLLDAARRRRERYEQTPVFVNKIKGWLFG